MKIKIILILFFFSVTNTFSQTKKNIKNNNVPQQSVKESVFIPVLESYYNYTRQNVDTYKTLFDVGYLFNEEEYRPKNTKNVIFDFNKFLLSEDKVTLRLGQRYYLNKYKSSIISTIENLSITNHQINKFAYLNDNEIPVHFFEHKNQSIMCHISNIVVEKLSDKNLFSSNERASKILASFLLPSLRSLEPMLELDIPYLGLSYLHGASNFSELKVVGEYISVISTTKIIKDYLNGMLTINEFLALSDIYLSDRNMGSELKKVNVFINEY